MTHATITDETAFEVFSGTLAGLFSEAQSGILHDKITFEWGPPTETAHCDMDKRLVVVPWPGKKPTREQYEILRGYVLHEMGHCIWTEKDLMSKAHDKHGHIGKDITNIFEDERINSFLRQKYGTAGPAFRTVWEHLVKSGKMGTPEQRAALPAKNRLFNDLLAMCAGVVDLVKFTSDAPVLQRLHAWRKEPKNHYNNTSTPDRTDSFMKDFADILTPPAKQDEQEPEQSEQPGDQAGKPGKKRSKKNKNSKSEKSSESSHEDSDEKETEQDEPDARGSDKQDGDSDGDSDGDGDGEEDRSDSDDGEADDDTGTGDDAPDEGADDGSDEGADEAESNQGSTLQQSLDKGSVFDGAEENNRAYREIKDTRDAASHAASHPALPCMSEYSKQAIAEHRDADPEIAKVRRLGAQCSATVRQAFAANARTADLTDLDDGELDPDKFPDLARGQWDAPFMKPGRMIHARNTAVHVCIDNSGSMTDVQPPSTKEKKLPMLDQIEKLTRHLKSANSNATFHEAVTLAVRVLCGPKTEAQARERPHLFDCYLSNPIQMKPDYLLGYASEIVTNLACPVTQVNGAALALHDAMRGARVPHEISGFTNGEYCVFKDFRNPQMSPVQRRVLNCGYASSGTPAARAWKRGVGSLMLRREPRKVMLVMTDGEVDDGPAAKAVLDTARLMKIEVYGVGLNDDNIRTLFPKDSPAVTIVHGLLAPELITIVRKIITKSGLR